MKTKKEIGIKGEYLAKKYLESKGFQVIDQNYRKKIGEIDIICKKDNLLHFIEVKSIQVNARQYIAKSDMKMLLRDEPQKGQISKNPSISPEDKITPIKIKKILKTGELYKLEKGFTEEYQIHILGIYLHYLKDTLLRVQVKFIPNIEVPAAL